MSESKSQKVTVEPVKSSEPAPTSAPAPSYFEESERELDRMFDSLLSRFRPLWPLRRDFPSLRMPFEGRMPKIDVIERDDEIVVKAELPGVDKKDLDVSVTDNTVTIKASTRRESKEEKGDYHRQEISTGYVSRTVGLPNTVDPKKATAALKDGVLELTLGKVEKTKRQRIEVK